MKTFGTILGLTLVVGVAPVAADDMDCHSEANELHLHIGHLMSCWDDTPDQAGLLVIAESEAVTALEHARLAMAETADVGVIIQHLGHVVHALNPELQPEGPGLDYGLILAAEGALVHIDFALEAEGAFGMGSGEPAAGYGEDAEATDAVTGPEDAAGDAVDEALAALFEGGDTGTMSELIIHQTAYARSSIANAVEWSTQALEIAQSATEGMTLDQASINALAVVGLLTAVIEGQDLDGDGKISAQTGEGGLGQAHAAVSVIMAAERIPEHGADTGHEADIEDGAHTEQ